MCYLGQIDDESGSNLSTELNTRGNKENTDREDVIITPDAPLSRLPQLQAEHRSLAPNL